MVKINIDVKFRVASFTLGRVRQSLPLPPISFLSEQAMNVGATVLLINDKNGITISLTRFADGITGT